MVYGSVEEPIRIFTRHELKQPNLSHGEKVLTLGWLGDNKEEIKMDERSININMQSARKDACVLIGGQGHTIEKKLVAEVTEWMFDIVQDLTAKKLGKPTEIKDPNSGIKIERTNMEELM